MTPEELFVAKLSCQYCTAAELWQADEDVVSFYDSNDTYFYAVLDTYVTCCNVYLPAGIEFEFKFDEADVCIVELK